MNHHWKQFVGGRVPDRWSDYSSYGSLVPAPRQLPIAGFFPCKTPLDGCFAAGLQASSVPWTVGDLVAAASRTSNPPTGIAAVINLCATERYYKATDLRSQGIEYYWLKIEGKGDIPPLAQIMTFLELIVYISFRHPGKIIVIHCTHGINRTGLFSALIPMAFDGLPCAEVVERIEALRGHQITKLQFVNFLEHLEPTTMYGSNFRASIDRMILTNRSTAQTVPATPPTLVVSPIPFDLFDYDLIMSLLIEWWAIRETTMSSIYPGAPLAQQLELLCGWPAAGHAVRVVIDSSAGFMASGILAFRALVYLTEHAEVVQSFFGQGVGQRFPGRRYLLRPSITNRYTSREQMEDLYGEMKLVPTTNPSLIQPWCEGPVGAS